MIGSPDPPYNRGALDQHGLPERGRFLLDPSRTGQDDRAGHHQIDEWNVIERLLSLRTITRSRNFALYLD
jgi:hypothetical protein